MTKRDGCLTEAAPCLPQSEDAKPVETQTVETKPIEAQTVETNPVEAQTVETNPVEAQAVAVSEQTIVAKTFCSLQSSKCGNLFSVVCNSIYCFCAVEMGVNYISKKRCRSDDVDEGQVIKKQNTIEGPN